MKILPFRPKNASNLSPSKCDGRKFWITGATAGNGKYGETLILDAEFCDTNQKTQICAKMEKREELFEQLREELKKADAIGPVRFEQIGEGKFYHLKPADDEEEEEPF